MCWLDNGFATQVVQHLGEIAVVVQHRKFRRGQTDAAPQLLAAQLDRKSTRLNSSHVATSYAVSCLKKKSSRGRTRVKQQLVTVHIFDAQVLCTARAVHRL